MRPIKLELEGFTSFRQRSELCFSDLDLFAITGPTGAGKSSLLDAITYALFGRTPRLGKSGTARELVSQGSLNMFVRMEFQAGIDIYQVYRTVRGSGSRGQLEKKAPDGSWIPETSSIRDLEERIQRIVGLTFEGFTRAVILPQGKFDEFLRGDAKQRREVLKDLLSLQVLEKMMQRANSKAQNFSAESKRAESLIEQGVTEEKRKELENSIAELAVKQTDQAQFISKLEIGQSIAEELSRHRINESAHQREKEMAERESLGLKEKLQTLQITAQDKQKALDKLNAAISAIAYDPDQHIRTAQLIPEVKRFAILGTQITELNEKEGSEQRELESNSSKLTEAEAALRKAEESKKDAEEEVAVAKRNLENLLSRHGLPQTVRALAADLGGLGRQEHELANLRSEERELQERLSRKDSVLTELSETMRGTEIAKNAADERLERLKTQHRAIDLKHTLHLGEPCPVCEQTVAKLPSARTVPDLEEAKHACEEAQQKFDQARQALLGAPGSFTLLEKEIAHKAEKIQSILLLVTSVRERFKTVVGAEPEADPLRQLEELASSIEHAQGDAAAHDQQLEACRQADSLCRTQAESLKNLLEIHKHRLADFAGQIQQMQNERTQLEKKFTNVVDLISLERQLEELERAKKEREALEVRRIEADSALNVVQKDAADVSGRLDVETKRADRARRDFVDATQHVKSAQQRLCVAVAPLELEVGQELEKLKEELRGANKILRDLDSEKKEQMLRLASLIEKLARNEELREERNRHKHAEAVYHELGTLLSADHFQDYMLQSSYRLLANEGSRYFEDLTGGRYSFHSEEDQFSVRDHSNGDELRSVSTLSGGESFLASLSLALALAQSIVELSGERGAVALESLFLDEGFSTLDPETLGKVADALPALQKKGRLIGVITHIEALAEQLPSRIEIAKTPTGSYIVQPRVALEVAATTA